jgi:hypothetical protein
MLKWPDVLNLAKSGNPAPDRKVVKTDAEWREQLSDEEYHVTRQAGTERAFSSEMCSPLSRESIRVFAVKPSFSTRQRNSSRTQAGLPLANPSRRMWSPAGSTGLRSWNASRLSATLLTPTWATSSLLPGVLSLLRKLPAARPPRWRATDERAFASPLEISAKIISEHLAGPSIARRLIAEGLQGEQTGPEDNDYVLNLREGFEAALAGLYVIAHRGEQ